MSLPQAIAALLAIAAAASYVNRRYLGLPPTIGLTALALAASLLFLVLGALTPLPAALAERALARLDFRRLVLDGLLPFLLFAGALHVDLRALRAVRLAVAMLDTVGVAVATVAAGVLFLLAARFAGFDITLLQALLFGALIAPTDPVAVLGILRGAGAPSALSTAMAGESLFNDGVGIVLFLALLGAATGGEPLTASGLVRAFVLEGVVGLALGGALGWACSWLLNGVDDFPVEIFMTLALASGSYAAASALHLSGPLAAVAAGLVVGSHGRDVGMSAHTQERLDAFWVVIDEMANAVLFLALGLEMLVVSHQWQHILLGLLSVPAVLLARFLSVAPIIALLRGQQLFGRGAIAMLTWGGLRGGISIALTLLLPPGSLRDTLLAATYMVVVFSVLVQGLTLGRVARAYQG